MRIRTNDHEYTISLRCWDGTNWGPDFFDEVATDFACCHSHSEDGSIIACQSDVDDMLAWWSSEVESANQDTAYEGDGLMGAKEGTEYALFVNSVFRPHTTDAEPKEKPEKGFLAVVHFESSIDYCVNAKDEEEAKTKAEQMFSDKRPETVCASIADCGACDCWEGGMDE